MKIMPCPLNGPRNISEFACAGEVVIAPDANRCTDEEWADYVFMQTNNAGVVREWWIHVPSAYWFIAERDTRTDEIIRTYEASEVFAERVEFTPPESAGGEK
jgi:sarcosine oxidase subunit delta